MICTVCLRRVRGSRCPSHPHEELADATVPELRPWLERLWEERQRRTTLRASFVGAMGALVVGVPLGLLLASVVPFVPDRYALFLTTFGPGGLWMGWIRRPQGTFDDWLERTLSS